MLNKIKVYQDSILQAFFLLCFCLWYPFFDPTVIKLFPLLLLPFLTFHKNKALFLLAISLVVISSLFIIPVYSTVYIYYEAIFCIFLFLGINYHTIQINKVVILSSILALVFFIAQNFQLFPYIWQQPIVLLNYEFVDSSFTFPSFFGNPSPMCLFFIIASYSIKKQSNLQKIMYTLLCCPMILLSDSSIGIFLFILSTIYLFIQKKQIKFLLSFAVVIPLFIIIFYPQVIQRPFQTRYPLYILALKNISPFGNGPGDFHLKSGLLNGEDTTKFHLTRNQFHPHNDLIFYLYSYGFLGLLFRLLLYLLIFYLIIQDFKNIPLLFFIIQIQFSPDSFSLPASLLFFFFLGQQTIQSNLVQSSLFHFLSYLNNYLISKKFITPWIKGAHYILLIYFLIHLTRYNLNFQNIVNKKESFKKTYSYFSSPAFDYNLAVSYLKSNQLEKAKSTLLELQRISPHFQDLDYLLGHVYYSQQDLQQAKASLEMKLNIDAYHVYTYLFLADIFVELKDKSSAIKTIKRGLLCLPKDNLLINRLSLLE